MVARSRQRGIFPLSLHQTGQDRSEGLQAVRSSSFPPHIALRMAYPYYAWPRASRLSDTIAQIIYWQVIFGVFNLLNFLCKFVPIGTVPLRLLFGCAIVLRCRQLTCLHTTRSWAALLLHLPVLAQRRLLFRLQVGQSGIPPGSILPPPINRCLRDRLSPSGILPIRRNGACTRRSAIAKRAGSTSSVSVRPRPLWAPLGYG